MAPIVHEIAAGGKKMKRQENDKVCKVNLCWRQNMQENVIFSTIQGRLSLLTLAVAMKFVLFFMQKLVLGVAKQEQQK